METIDFTASALSGPAAAWTSPAAGFNHRGRAAADSNDLCAALLAIAGHDLRQPLQIIIGAHDLLGKILDGRIERVQLARAELAAAQLTERLEQLVGALRLFDPAIGGRQEIVELGPIFALLDREFAEAARIKGVRLRFVPTRAAIASNPVLLRGILRNLIRNAIDYTPAGGRALVAVRRRGAAVRIEVRDSGSGIETAELTEIFKPFRRLDTTRTDGLGLGLFIVKSAAAFLGHDVEVYSAPGRGSRFVVIANGAPASVIRLP